ncbi:MAG: HIT family protein [Flavobacteriales bacterium]|nr:HIT family protein [Flavobacteriales bacterium]|tara:strand:+ start:823 stop:1227 length:405 start_codon:yes stop_codon:yes gene_type:complete
MKSIFSQIINKQIPCHLIAENDYAIAFLDINPIALGHTLVVPKIQVDYLFDLDSDNYRELWSFAKLVSIAIKKTIACSRIGVSVVGFEVPHAHIHLIPINSIHDMNFSNKITISSVNIKKIAKDIANNFQGILI